MSCLEFLVKFASSIGIIKELHSPIGADEVLEANGTPSYGSTKGETRIEYIPLIFLIVDSLDVGLDIIFTVQLVMMGEYFHGFQMLSALFTSLWVWFYSKDVVSHAIASEYSLSTIRVVMTFRELTMFFIQDATTLHILASVPESFENNIFSRMNLYTMIACISILIGTQTYLAKATGCKRFWTDSVYYLLILGSVALLAFRQLVVYTYFISNLVWLFMAISNWYALYRNDWSEELLSKVGLANACFFCNSKDEEDE